MGRARVVRFTAAATTAAAVPNRFRECGWFWKFWFISIFTVSPFTRLRGYILRGIRGALCTYSIISSPRQFFSIFFSAQYAVQNDEPTSAIPSMSIVCPPFPSHVTEQRTTEYRQPTRVDRRSFRLERCWSDVRRRRRRRRPPSSPQLTSWRQECTAGRSTSVSCRSTRSATAAVGTIMSIIISGGAIDHDHHRDGNPCAAPLRHHDDAGRDRRVQDRRR